MYFFNEYVKYKEKFKVFLAISLRVTFFLCFNRHFYVVLLIYVDTNKCKIREIKKDIN